MGGGRQFCTHSVLLKKPRIMKELSKSKNTHTENPILGLYGKQCELLHGDPSLPKETLSALEELGSVLRGIHERMIREGYGFVEGCIQKTQ